MDSKNYSSINPACETEANWYLSCKFGTKVQVTAKLEDGKEYKYICRYPVQVGDIVIIGNLFASGTMMCETEPFATTGKFGVVTEVLPKIEIKRNHSAEIDFVFTKNPDKKTLKECAKYIALDDYYKTLQYSSGSYPVRPITHFARRLLAAASILANAGVADTASIAVAKECIQTKPILSHEVCKLSFGPPEYVPIDLSQTFIDSSTVKKELGDIKSSAFKEMIIDWSPREEYVELLDEPAIQEYIAKYSYVAAVSIMMRGAFANMLKAFLDVNPPIDDYVSLIKSTKTLNRNAEISGIVKAK